ncbi:MAG: Mrp/NBP35 family ATP-binding protein [Proteobacteria bacterium]|nr:Mrp/NBP35 family ATP-binding protein [Pseudomonadota bacterium]
MDPLEIKIKDVFKSIPFGYEGGNVLESDVVHSFELAGNIAQLVLIIPKKFESFIDGTTKKIESGLKEINEINEVGIKVVSSLQEAEGSTQKQQPGPQNSTHPGPPQQKSYLLDYENVILVASGKGGVGKSTVAVNLALALKSLGKKVSILDADVFGPSLPVMMGTRNEFPNIVNDRIEPMSKHGIEFMSIGNLVKEEESLIWRGPMVHQALEQMMRDTVWPGGDYMIIDLPPGTGDVQLTIAQMTSAEGVVVVCTPQDVALLDARKAIHMFDKVNIDVLGIIENMSSFICPKCGEETAIFSAGGAEKESKDQEVAFIGKIPIELDIREGGDIGQPVVTASPESKSAQVFIEIAKNLDKVVEEG